MNQNKIGSLCSTGLQKLYVCMHIYHIYIYIYNGGKLMYIYSKKNWQFGAPQGFKNCIFVFIYIYIYIHIYTNYKIWQIIKSNKWKIGRGGIYRASKTVYLYSYVYIYTNHKILQINKSNKWKIGRGGLHRASKTVIFTV